MSVLKYPDFRGPAKRIEDLDLPRIGHEIGVGEDEVHMLIEVEAAGAGFDGEGRPKMLFEPHIFYRELGAGKKRDQAVKEGLAYAKWKKGYPKDSYPRLASALKIDEEAALRSASWGATQVLGDNFKMAGFASVQDMVNAMCEDEEHHVEAMIEFCKASGIDDDLRRLAALTRPTTPEDCRIIAKTYNGPAYAENGYHTKMASAHNKWRKIPDTAWSPDSATGPIIAAQGNTTYFSEAQVKDVQQLLKDKGYVEVGKIDGKAGKDTAAAISVFQIIEGLPVDGKITQALIDRLKIAKMRPVSESRASATQADVVANAVPAVASTVKSAAIIKNAGYAALSLFGVGTVADGGVPDLDQFSSSLSKTQTIIHLIGDKLPWIIGAIAAVVAIYYGHKILSRQIEGFRKGTVK